MKVSGNAMTTTNATKERTRPGLPIQMPPRVYAFASHRPASRLRVPGAPPVSPDRRGEMPLRVVRERPLSQKLKSEE